MPITPGYCSKSFNTFVSHKKCMEMCDPRAKAMLQNCLKPPIIALCVAAQYAWYYDELTKSCKMFAHSTCKSNGNYFPSEMKCQSVCLPKMKPKPLCSADPVRDICLLKRKHIFFSFKNNTCMPFPKKGCGKGFNSFTTLQRCMDTCSYNQSTMVGPDSEQKPQNQLPPMGNPAVQHPARPVSPLTPIGPSMPLTPPNAQGTLTPAVSIGKPGLPGSQLSPTPPMNSGLPVQPAMPVSPSSQIPQSNPSSTFPSGSPATLPNSIGNPASPSASIPRGQLGSPRLPGPPAPPMQTMQSSQPTSFGQPSLSSSPSRPGNSIYPGQAVKPFPSAKPSPSRRAALPLRPGFHKK